MISLMDLDVKNKTTLLSNLSFDRPLSDLELGELINLLSSSINLSQVYFKEDIDIKSIEKVKLLLEGLPTVDDSKIEKYILKDISSSDENELANLSFLNIETWNIAYSKEKNRYSITTLAKYKKIKEWFSEARVNVEDKPLFDKILYLYDRVKLLEYASSKKYERLPEIIENSKANSYGYNLLFKELLNVCGIKASMGCVKVDGEISYVTLAILEDDDFSGIYVFDPSSDTISKDQYKNNLARRINYNFFGITLDKLLSQKGNIEPQGILRVFSSSDMEEFDYLLARYNEKNSCNDINAYKQSFGLNEKAIYDALHSSIPVSSEIICSRVINRLESVEPQGIEREFLNKTITDNYYMRDEELFDGLRNKTQKKKHDASQS